MTNRKRILIVDDQYGIRILLSEIFQSKNYMTFLAANGVQALEIMESEKPNLILLDLKMPGMDGIEILRKMKERNLNIDVIMMTAYGELKMINEAKELGVLTYIAKPFDITFVREEVEKYIHTNVKATEI